MSVSLVFYFNCIAERGDLMAELTHLEAKKVVSDCYDDYLMSLLAGDRRRCRDFVRQLLDQGVGVKILYSDLFRNSLYEVGSLWENNQVSVATEHLATAV